jgi:hypothetical protein
MNRRHSLAACFLLGVSKDVPIEAEGLMLIASIY